MVDSAFGQDADDAAEDAGSGAFSFEYVRWQLDGQADRVHSIHSRIGVLVGLNSVILGVFAIAAAIVVQDWTPEQQVPAILALGLFLASTAAAFRVIDLKRWIDGPPPSDVLRAEGDVGPQVVRLWATRQLALAFERNAAIIQMMERWTRVALICAFADAILASALLLLAMRV